MIDNKKAVIYIYPPKRILQKMPTDKFVIKPTVKIIIEAWMLSKQK
jgi:hypothetical protein